MKRHIELNHEKQAALFECNLCDYKAKKPHRIKDHKQAKHEGLTFNCDKCDFKNSSKNYLKTHKRVKHEVKEYVCELCDFKTLRYWQFIWQKILVPFDTTRKTSTKILCIIVINVNSQQNFTKHSVTTKTPITTKSFIRVMNVVV